MEVICALCGKLIEQRLPLHDPAIIRGCCSTCYVMIKAARRAYVDEKYKVEQGDLFDSAAPHDQDPTENNRELKKNRETNHRGKKMENR